MKKNLLMSVLVLGVFSASSYAADGIVTFTGNITESGCTVTNATNKVINVPMGNYSSSALSNAGQEAGSKHFEINLENCIAGAVKVRFHGTPVSGNSELLKLTPTGHSTNDPANTVGIKIIDLVSNQVYRVGDTTSTVPFQNVDSKGSINIKLAARYHAFSDGTPSGEANSSANFSIEYQ